MPGPPSPAPLTYPGASEWVFYSNSDLMWVELLVHFLDKPGILFI